MFVPQAICSFAQGDPSTFAETAGTLEKRLQSLFVAGNPRPIRLRATKDRQRRSKPVQTGDQANCICSKESAERSQELNRIFDGCLSLRPSGGAVRASGQIEPKQLETSATKKASSGNVAALVAAFSADTPTYKNRVSQECCKQRNDIDIMCLLIALGRAKTSSTTSHWAQLHRAALITCQFSLQEWQSLTNLLAFACNVTPVSGHPEF